MSLATLHYMRENGERRTVTADSTYALQLAALEISARVPAYVVTVDDGGHLLVVRYHGGRLLGETVVEPEGPVTQVTVFGDADDADAMEANW
jgi:hypothetical protein